MSIPTSDDDPRRGDGVIGNAQDPLPEPWFIRAARGSDTQVERGPEPGPMILPSAAMQTDAAPAPVREPLPSLPSRPTPWRTLAIGAAILIAAIIAWLAVTPKQGGAPPVAELPNDGGTAAMPAAAPLDCASPAAIARLRDVLIGQARQGGAGGAALDGRAGGLSVSVGAAPDLRSGDGRTLDCRGTLSLPAVGGDAAVTAPVEYRIRPAAGGAVDVATVTGAAPIVAALAGPTSVPVDATSADEEFGYATDEPLRPGQPPALEPRAIAIPPARVSRPAALPAPRTELPPPPEALPAPEAEFSRPSFDCRRVSSRVLEAVCASPRLAALDVEMSELFFEVRDTADRETRADLEASRADFLARRQSCRSDACIARTYRERIAELEGYR